MIHEQDIITQVTDQTKVTRFIHAKVSMHPRSWVVGAMWHAEGSSLYLYPLPMICVAVHMPVWATWNQLLRWIRSPTPWLIAALFVMLPLGVIIGWMTRDHVDPLAPALSSPSSSVFHHTEPALRMDEAPKQIASISSPEPPLAEDAGVAVSRPYPSATARSRPLVPATDLYGFSIPSAPKPVDPYSLAPSPKLGDAGSNRATDSRY